MNDKSRMGRLLHNIYEYIHKLTFRSLTLVDEELHRLLHAGGQPQVWEQIEREGKTCREKTDQHR